MENRVNKRRPSVTCGCLIFMVFAFFFFIAIGFTSLGALFTMIDFIRQMT